MTSATSLITNQATPPQIGFAFAFSRLGNQKVPSIASHPTHPLVLILLPLFGDSIDRDGTGGSAPTPTPTPEPEEIEGGEARYLISSKQSRRTNSSSSV
jgi:hypothetical protein